MRAYLKASILALSLLCAGVLVSPSAQVSIQRGFNVVSQYMDIVGTSATYKWVVSGTSLLLQSSTGGAFSTVGTFTSGGALSVESHFTAQGDIQNFGNIYGGTSSFFSFLTRSVVRSNADGNLRIASNNESNTHDITLADWGTTTSAEAVSVADTVVLAGPASGVGTLTISIGTDNNVCVFALTGTAAPVELNDPGTLCSITAGTATSLNVYYSAGYQIQNLRGGTRAIRAVFVGG